MQAWREPLSKSTAESTISEEAATRLNSFLFLWSSKSDFLIPQSTKIQCDPLALFSAAFGHA
jgi:hypothetical protein